MNSDELGAYTCPFCRDSGLCAECQGLGRLPCHLCDGLGCRDCELTGTETCRFCEGTGRCRRCAGDPDTPVWRARPAV
ncbi:MAG: hypothetical protein Q7T33_08245 [Dehalococcoidia bacterium]|nr:hypothetical protein [Dehalococcoidia bacterium]